jgi:hypothetical protein
MLGGPQLEVPRRDQRGRTGMGLDGLPAHDSGCCGPGSKRTEVDCKLYVSVFTSEQGITYVLYYLRTRGHRIKLKK